MAVRRLATRGSGAAEVESDAKPDTGPEAGAEAGARALRRSALWDYLHQHYCPFFRRRGWHPES